MQERVQPASQVNIPLLCTCETTSLVLHPVFAFSVQEWQQWAGLDAKRVINPESKMYKGRLKELDQLRLEETQLSWISLLSAAPQWEGTGKMNFSSQRQTVKGCEARELKLK